MEYAVYCFIDFVIEKAANIFQYTHSVTTSFPLHDAVEKNNISQIFKILRTTPVDTPGPDGKTALIKATLKPFTSKSRRIIKILLRKGADPLRKHRHRSAAYIIFRENDMDLMKAVLQFIPDINHPVHYNNKLLDIAVKNRNSAMVQTLLDLGADFVKEDHKEIPYLHEAACSMEPSLVRIFLKAGLNVNSRDRLERTPLHYAALAPTPECLEQLLKAKPEMNPIDKEGNTPINLAIKKNHRLRDPMLALMLKYDSNPNIPDQDGCTPLHNVFVGCSWVSLLKVKLLVKKGANTNLKNDSGKTPLHLSLDTGYFDCSELLITMGADINIKDSGDLTALHLAYYYENTYLVYVMIKHLVMLKHVRYREIGKDVMQLIISNDDLLIDFIKFEDEISELKFRLGDSNLSCAESYWYNRKIVAYARNDKVKCAVHKFDSTKYPRYGGKIRMNLERALYRRHLEDVTEKSLTDIFRGVLPHSCVTNIVSFFTDKELQLLTKKTMNIYNRKDSVRRANLYLNIGMVIFFRLVLHEACRVAGK